MARLSRSSSGYKMVIASGETKKYPINEVVGAKSYWPHAFVKMDIKPDDLVQSLEANHMHLVAGDHREVLVKFCKMMDIESILI